MKKLKAYLFVVTILIAAAGLIYLGYMHRDSQAGRFLRLIRGRSSRCSLGKAWDAVRLHQALWSRIYEITDECEVLQTDSTFELVKFGERRYWIPLRNRMALSEMIAEQETDVYGVDNCSVQKGDVVLDCGTNVGVYTRHALDGGARLVVAIDPAPESIECLRRNFSAEIKAGRIIVYPKGVWDKDEVIKIRTFEQQSGGDSVALNFPGSREGPAVMLTTIDKIVRELRLERVDFIKMDIEGSERKALVGARNTVARFKPRMAISMEHLPDDFEALTAVIANLWPDLKTTCGPCHWVNTALVNRIQPEVLYVER
jgi:FkbM family methyltransferase